MKTLITCLILNSLLFQTTIAQDDRLIVNYKFNDNTDDISGNNHHGIEYGNPTYVEDRFGNAAQAIYLDGDGDYISVNDHSDLECNNVKSITAWFKPEKKTYGNIIVSKYKSDTPDEDGYIVGLGDKDNLRMWVKDGNSGGGEVPALENFGEYSSWNFVCFVMEEDTLRGFLNGNEFSNTYYTHSAYQGNIRNLILGGAYSGEYNAVSYYSYFKGALDDIRIYNKPLTASEISNLYNEEGNSNPDPGTNELVIYYPFEGNATDQTGNSNDATNVNTTFGTDRFGNASSSAVFNGSTSEVILPDEFHLGDVFTVSGWAYARTPQYKNGSIFQSDWSRQYSYYEPFPYSINLQFKEDESLISTSWDVPYFINGVDSLQWFFWTLTCDGSTYKVYIDGKEEHSQSVTPDYGMGTYFPARLGRITRNTNAAAGDLQNYWFNGKIDDVRIFNYVLSDAEINDLYTENGWTGDVPAPEAPEITQHPASKTKNIGETATFSVEATGNDLTYLWKKDGVDLANNDRVSGATAASISISDLIETDAGAYSCVVTNTKGSVISDEATLTVTDPNNLSELVVGGVTFYAENIVTENETEYQLSGNVNINNLLYFSGDVNANLSTLRVSGNGELVVPNVPVIGDYALYAGAFDFEVSDIELDFLGLDDEGHAVELGKLKVAFEKLALLENGVELEGEITLSSQLDHATASINKLQITTDGIKLLSTISVKDVKIYHKIKLDTLGLTFNTIDDFYSGSALVNTPLFGVGASAVISEGMLESVGATFQPANPIALGTTGVSISEGYARVEGLKERPVSITLGVDLVPTAQGSTDVVKFDNLQITYEVPKSFYGSGRLLVFDREMASAYISVVPNKISFGGELNVYNILLGKLDAALIIIDDNINIYGYLGASIQWPAGDGFVYDLIDPIMDFPIKFAHTDNYLKNNIFAGNMTIVKLNVNYSLEWKDGELHRHLGRGLENWNDILFDGDFDDYINTKAAHADPLEGHSYLINRYTNKPRLKSTSAGLEQGFVLNTITPNIIVRVMADEELPQYAITLPNGVKLNSANGNAFDYSMYVENKDKNMTFYSINNPPLGDYLLNIEDNGYDYYVDVVGASAGTRVTLDSLKLEEQQVNITWEALSINGNDKISLFYSSSDQATGSLIQQGIDLSQSSYSWDIADLPTGEYTVFAAIEQDETVSGMVYAPNKLQLLHKSAPLAPVELSGYTTDTSMVLTWKPGSDEINQYLVYYSEGKKADFNDTRVKSLGIDTSFVFTTFDPGNTYHFAISAVDTATYLESAKSDTIRLAYESTSINNVPRIDSVVQPNYIFTNEVATISVYASDGDMDELTYSLHDEPLGMSISGSGQISWTPGNESIGNQYFTLLVSDGMATDTLRLSCTVFDKSNPGIELSPLVPSYSSYCDVGGITITDAFANKHSNVKDTIQVRVSASATDDELILMAAESSPNSKVFHGTFEFTDEANAEKLEVAPSDILNFVYNNELFANAFTYTGYFMERINHLTIRQIGEYQEKGDTVLLIAPVDVQSYLWSTGETDDTLVVTAPGEYHVVVSDKCGNIAQSETFAITGETTDVINQSMTSIKMVPNPAHDMLWIYPERNLKHAELTITDLSGRSIFIKTFSGVMADNPLNIDVRQFQNGTYMVTIRSEHALFKGHFMVVHAK